MYPVQTMSTCALSAHQHSILHLTDIVTFAAQSSKSSWYSCLYFGCWLLQ